MTDEWIVWRGGDWLGGGWLGGEWHGGDWHDGEWFGGRWHGGVWHGGVWHGGVWFGGEWRDARIDRLLFMASQCGIVFDADGWAVGWRTTTHDGRGRYSPRWVQPEGEYYESDAEPAGSSTCCKGIHVASQATAMTYFGVNTTAQLWRVRFRREDLLDCDGQKARIRGGVFEKTDCSWLRRATNTGD